MRPQNRNEVFLGIFNYDSYSLYLRTLLIFADADLKKMFNAILYVPWINFDCDYYVNSMVHLFHNFFLVFL